MCIRDRADAAGLFGGDEAAAVAQGSFDLFQPVVVGGQLGGVVAQARLQDELLAGHLHQSAGHAVGLGGRRVGLQQVVEGGVGRQAALAEGLSLIHI